MRYYVKRNNRNVFEKAKIEFDDVQEITYLKCIVDEELKRNISELEKFEGDDIIQIYIKDRIKHLEEILNAFNNEIPFK